MSSSRSPGARNGVASRARCSQTDMPGILYLFRAYAHMAPIAGNLPWLRPRVNDQQSVRSQTLQPRPMGMVAGWVRSPSRISAISVRELPGVAKASQTPHGLRLGLLAIDPVVIAARGVRVDDELARVGPGVPQARPVRHRRRQHHAGPQGRAAGPVPAPAVQGPAGLAGGQASARDACQMPRGTGAARRRRRPGCIPPRPLSSATHLHRHDP
jgi:hypothetical protein